MPSTGDRHRAHVAQHPSCPQSLAQRARGHPGCWAQAAACPPSLLVCEAETEAWPSVSLQQPGQARSYVQFTTEGWRCGQGPGRARPRLCSAALQRPLELVPRQVLPDGGLGAGGVSQLPPDHLWGVGCQRRAYPSTLLPCSAKLPTSLSQWEGKRRLQEAWRGGGPWCAHFCARVACSRSLSRRQHPHRPDSSPDNPLPCWLQRGDR